MWEIRPRRSIGEYLPFVLSLSKGECRRAWFDKLTMIGFPSPDPHQPSSARVDMHPASPPRRALTTSQAVERDRFSPPRERTFAHKRKEVRGTLRAADRLGSIRLYSGCPLSRRCRVEHTLPTAQAPQTHRHCGKGRNPHGPEGRAGLRFSSEPYA